MALPVTIDFETVGIEQRPTYPPKPVGLAVWEPGKKPEYLAFAHATENNTTFEVAQRRYKDILNGERPILGHNMKFDLDVGEVHFKVSLPPWQRIHDTQPLAALVDPYASSYALKSLADDILDMPPEERDELQAWILKNIPEAKGKKKEWARWIWRAPGTLAGKYARGDVVRTRKLFDKLHPVVMDAGMSAAYDRERKLISVLLKNERLGVRVDLDGLTEGLPQWEAALAAADGWLAKKLKVKDLDVDSREDLADALTSAGVVTEWPKTPKSGKRKTSKDVFAEVVQDAGILAALAYRGKLANSIRTFVRPWIAQAQKTGGLIHTQWNSTRQSNSGENRDLGAKTGRLSTTPNVQNITRAPVELTTTQAEFERITEGDMTRAILMPASLRKVVSPLPNLRTFVLPDPGDVLLDRDYSQQELRILAHYEDGLLLQKYREDPRMDVHAFTRNLINTRLGTNYPRTYAKMIALATLYGMGKPKLAERIGTDVDTAGVLRAAFKETLPGVKELEDYLRQQAREGKPIYTLGGRRYYVEDSQVINGELRSFGYRLLNYLIQGSAADMMKEAVLRYNETARDSRWLLLVHDEAVISSHRKARDTEMRKLREAMESVPLDAPLLTDGKTGPTWGTLTPYDDKRKT